MPIAPTLSQNSRNAIQGTVGCMLRAHPLRSLAPSEYLFQRGDRLAQPYRVERGSLCHYTRRDDGSLEIIEFVFRGRHNWICASRHAHLHRTRDDAKQRQCPAGRGV